MSTPNPTNAAAWPLWQRIFFRFFFVYLLLQTGPWEFFDGIPWLGRVIGRVTRYYDRADDWAVHAANARFFHVREKLIPMNGSGDTSYAWAQLWLFLCVAAAVCLIWSLLDRRRANYARLLYWLRTFTRYYIASAALSYGIIKLFKLQMLFPTLSQLATPLGDFLPMRFSWLFIGYSNSYQFFSGAMETIAGLLLLRRNTVTLGLFAATGAFLNVVMINLSYDVPVKMFSMHLLFACLFLLALDAPRLFTFLVLNRPAPATTAYVPHYTAPWQRFAAMGAKALILVAMLVMPVWNSWNLYQSFLRQPAAAPIRAGVYDVTKYVVNGVTIPPLNSDSVRWRDVIIDNNLQGSVGTTDSVFWQRYHRGYFRYKPDTAKHMLAVWKTNTAFDSTFLFTVRYEVPDTNTVRLWTAIRKDSVYVELVRTNRHFQLAERQFHWLSEYNR
jgi:hypothetical protein